MAEDDPGNAIDQAIMDAMPFYAKKFSAGPLLYHAGERHMTITCDRIEELAAQTQFSAEQLKDRFVQLGWVYAETDEEAQEISEERDRKHAETMARLTQMNRRDGIDDQYGVLQPLANAMAGCFGLWQWVILLFLIALIAVGVRSIFE